MIKKYLEVLSATVVIGILRVQLEGAYFIYICTINMETAVNQRQTSYK